jgi:hypothetical protein
VRGRRFGAFARVRPGMVHFSRRFFAPDTVCILIFPTPESLSDARNKLRGRRRGNRRAVPDYSVCGEGRPRRHRDPVHPLWPVAGVEAQFPVRWRRRLPFLETVRFAPDLRFIL